MQQMSRIQTTGAHFFRAFQAEQNYFFLVNLALLSEVLGRLRACFLLPDTGFLLLYVLVEHDSVRLTEMFGDVLHWGVRVVQLL